MATLVETFRAKRPGIKTLEQLKSFILSDMRFYAFSVSFPNGDVAMGTGECNIFLHAPSKYLNVKPIYQVGLSEEDCVARVVKALPRMIAEVRELEEIEEANKLESSLYAPTSIGSLRPQGRVEPVKPRRPARQIPAPRRRGRV